MKLRNFIKNNLKLVVAFTLGLLVAGTGVYAAVVITSKEITYEDNTSIGATNVQDAIDKLYAKADNQYFDLATAKANTTGKVFASKKGVCISRNKTVYCFKISNYDVEKNHIQQAFSGGICDVDSSYVSCGASDADFSCYVYSNGDVYCIDDSDNSFCLVLASGDVDCR